VELKATVNLPRTDFPMKANLPQNEPKMLARWEQMRLYELIRESRKGQPVFILHDGPPYANGAIHLGHALNKCLKDFVVKSKTMAGYDSPYVPGWDCHGLPIEIKVDEVLGRKKLQLDPLHVREECRKYAEKYLNIQREQFKRIGVFGDFDHPYSTMEPEYEARVLENFYAFLERDMVYKGLKPVYWCIYDKTALAEAEVEYENHSSHSIWVRYALTSPPEKIAPEVKGKQVATIIWTTTPWTLPASMAVAFNPNEEYIALERGEWVYIVADRLAVETAKNCHFGEDLKILARFPGAKLEHQKFAHPFLERRILGVLADYVTMDQGTGAVHTAPSHGADDFYTGVKYELDQTCNVDEAGHLVVGLDEYKGKRVFEANEPIVQLLKARGVLLGHGKLEHSYPHCWRCHKPVIFRATEQWFISMEGMLGERTLRAAALDEIKKVKWDPAWGEERIANMVATRPDWCISRQRIWGVPIAVFHCEGCKTILRSKEADRAVVELVRAQGTDAWYAKAAAEILPAVAKCQKCGGTSFRKEMDIIDVWFESGASQAAVLDTRADLSWPSDLYLEGGDQYRGWFMSSLLCALGLHGAAPFRIVATPGWTLDEEGRAMSKSRGNDVDPVEIAKRLGGEIVRLWVASVDFREDVRGSENLMLRIAETYRKMRNTFRYILGNLDGFVPSRDALKFDELEPIDQHMLLLTADFAAEIKGWYEEMAFHRIYQRFNEFMVVDLSAAYFYILRDRLYTFPRSSRERRSAQTAVWRIGEALVRLIAPILSFTAEEIWQFLPKMQARPESVHLALFPTAHDITGEEVASAKAAAIESDWEKLFHVRNEVLQALEALRQEKVINDGLEARVTLVLSGALHELLERYAAHLPALFVVSAVQIKKHEGEMGVLVDRAPGAKCERCWNFSTHVGEDKAFPTVCERCSAALKVIAGEPKA